MGPTPFLPRAGRAFGRGLLLLASLLANSGEAHEFWLLPDAFSVPVGGAALLSLSVGQDFAGEPVAFSRPLVVDLRQLARETTQDLRPRLPGTGTAAAVRVRLARAGTHVIALDTLPNAIELPADKFNEYLRQEGLMAVLQAREEAGASGLPGREHYRRNVKTLIRAGDASDATYRRRTGQRLELVPLADPDKLVPGQALQLQLWFDDRPLAGALVKLWNGKGAGLLARSGVTNAQGHVAIDLPRAGAWMASVVHMIPAQGPADHDWDSYWGNLTFALPLPAAAQDGDGSGAPRR